jgi:DNA polymerase-1
VPIGHRYLGAPAQISMDALLEVIGPLLSDPTIAKVGHDVKFNEVVLLRHGVKIEGVTFDSMLASYLHDPEAENELPAIAEREASIKMPSYDAIAPSAEVRPSARWTMSRSSRPRLRRPLRRGPPHP